MIKTLVALIPLLPWLVGGWIAVARVGRFSINERKIGHLSTLSALVVLLLILGLDVIALIQGLPGQVDVGTWFESDIYHVPISFTLDWLSLGHGTLVALLMTISMRFSTNYLHHEAGMMRFMMVMNLFAGSMMLIILSGNAVLTFVGWELAGVSSFLLIGYALDRPIATRNAQRAMVTNRIGDAGFILGIFLAYKWMGSVSWDQIHTLELGNDLISQTSLIACGFMLAALAKSAQFPFSPWISRALDGPTPSSAIFYGALMVHAGLYLTLRLAPLLVQEPWIMTLLVIVGLLTAFYGWISGLVQSDVKSALIFSTISQVGLMFFMCGMGWFTLAAWAMAAHASWRAWQLFHAPSLGFMTSKPAQPVPRWLSNQHWLYTAAQQRFWLEQIGDMLFTHSARKMAQDTRMFEERVVDRLIGVPSGESDTISSLVRWQAMKFEGGDHRKGHIGYGQGVFGKLIQTVATLLHWVEKHMVLKGTGENFLSGLQMLGNQLLRIDLILSRPRYLIFMIVITFVIIL
ncbi:MAG: hypothetical protein HQL54_06160 [Magnetococcales bacterium]|nr:hypothetical protein [Magnetococcales bacterium]